MEINDPADNYTSSDEDLPSSTLAVLEHLSLAPKERVSGFFILINTQVTETKLSVTAFKEYLEEVLFTKVVLAPLLGLKDYLIKEVEILAPGIEVAPKNHRVHTHFTLVCHHYSKIYLQGMQRRWQNFIKATLPVYSRGVFVSIQLLDYSTENYILKDQEPLVLDL